MGQTGCRALRTPWIGVLALNIGALAHFLMPAKLELQRPALSTINRATFAVGFDASGITSITNPRDPLRAQFLAQGAHLGDPIVRYKSGDHDWTEISTQDRKLDADPENGTLIYTDGDSTLP